MFSKRDDGAGGSSKAEMPRETAMLHMSCCRTNDTSDLKAKGPWVGMSSCCLQLGRLAGERFGSDSKRARRGTVMRGSGWGMSTGRYRCPLQGWPWRRKGQQGPGGVGPSCARSRRAGSGIRGRLLSPLCGKVKGSGKEEEEERRRSLKGLAEEPGRDLEPEEPDPVLDCQSRWKRWAADIEFRLALFESPEKKSTESGGRGQLDSQGVGEALELELEAREDPRPKAAGSGCSSETSEPDPSLALEPEPASPKGEEPSPARGLAQGEASHLLLSPETGPSPSPSPGGDFSFAQALDLEDVEVLGTDPSSSRLTGSRAEARPALKERCIARWCFQLRKAPSLLSEPSEAFSRRTLALHRQHIVASIPSSITSIASAPASPRSREGDFHSRGQQWLEEKRAKEHHLREQHRDLELRECTFQPVMPSRASRSRSAGQSARSVYDRQRRWQEAVREKHDRQRQRQRADDTIELARYKTKGQPQEDVEHAFACFHERNRKWQSMRQARQAQQQKQQQQLERSPRRASSVAAGTTSRRNLCASTPRARPACFRGIKTGESE